MNNPTKTRKVVLHPIQVLLQASLMTPEQWGMSVSEVERGRNLLTRAAEVDVDLYLVGWPDDVRVAVISPFQPGTPAWAQGILKGYSAAVRGMRGIVRTSTL